MATFAEGTLISGNLVFLTAAAILAISVTYFAAHHAWLTAYGHEQARLRFWMAVCLVLLTLLAVAAIAFNLLFS